jgi:hypothetical protein
MMPPRSTLEGIMPVDREKALGASLGETEGSYETDDVILYHLGIGAGFQATDPRELEYTYEKNLKVLPSFGVVAASSFSSRVRQSGDGGDMGLGKMPGLEFNPAMLLHGEQDIEIHKPLPTAASFKTQGRIADVFDKGKAALVIIENESRDESGEPLFTIRMSLFLRGEGGFGGPSGPKAGNVAPERAPDGVVASTTLPQQALLYRLCGDKNPLHADPEFAKMGGFDTPIIHGLCSYGTRSSSRTRPSRCAAERAGSRLARPSPWLDDAAAALQHHQRDLARGVVPVAVEGRVGFHEQRPEPLAVGLLRPAGHDVDALAAHLDASLGPRRQVEPPGRRPIVSGVRGRDHPALAVRDVEQRRGALLPRSTSRVAQQQELLAERAAADPTAGHAVDEAVQGRDERKEPADVRQTHGTFSHRLQLRRQEGILRARQVQECPEWAQEWGRWFRSSETRESPMESGHVAVGF